MRASERHLDCPPAPRPTTRPNDPPDTAAWRDGPLCRVRIGRWVWQVRPGRDVQRWLEQVDTLFNAERDAADVRVLKRCGTADVAGAGDPPTWLIKRYNFRKWLNPLKDAVRGTRAKRAFMLGRELERLGIPTATVAAFGEQRRAGLPVRACLVTRFIDDAMNLMQLLSEGDPATLEQVVPRVARLVARLHVEGFANRDLKADNFMVRTSSPGEPNDVAVSLVDLDGLRYVGRVGGRLRERNLRRLRRSFREAGQGEGGAWDRFMAVYRDAVQPTRTWRDGASLLAVHRDYAATLEQAGLTSYDAVAALPPDETHRAVPGRTTYRVRLPIEGEDAAAYVKISRRPSLWRRLRRLDVFGSGKGAAWNEWRRLNQLASYGIPAPLPIAFGRRRGRGGGEGGHGGGEGGHGSGDASLVMMSELAGAMQGDDYVAALAAKVGEQGWQREKRRLIEQAADLARQFHQAGFHHQDFYLCHFWFRPRADGRHDIWLLDHHRTGHRPLLTHRWLVKDIGQLHYSLPAALFTATDRVRFLRRYFGVERLRPSHKRFARAAMRKARRIARHEPRHAFARPTSAGTDSSSGIVRADG